MAECSKKQRKNPKTISLIESFNCCMPKHLVSIESDNLNFTLKSLVTYSSTTICLSHIHL